MNNMNETEVIEEAVDAEERKTIISAALGGLQHCLTVLQKFGVIDATQTLSVPTMPATTAPTPMRDVKGHFIPRGVATPKKPKKAKALVAAYKKPTAPAIVPLFVKWFIQTDEKNLYNVKRGQWECIEGVWSDNPKERRAHMLVFHGRRLGADDKAMGRNVVCIRPINGLVPIFNASRIRYGTSWAAQQNPQRLAEEYGAVPVPFESVISPTNGAGLDPAKMEVLAWGGPERLIIPPVNRSGFGNSGFAVINRHFAGAVLLKIEDRYFLFDADREELKYCNFNPFFTELDGPALSIAEAYEKMAPKEVHAARKAGITVVRQGEFFFVNVPDAEVTGDIKDDFDKRIVSIIVNDIDTLGAAVVNTMELDRTNAMHNFVVKYTGTDHSNDKPDEVISDINTVLAPVFERLHAEHGPEAAWNKSDDEKRVHRPIYYSYGEGHTGTHVDHIRDALTVRLHQTHGADRKYGIQFATVLTSQLINPREDGQTGGQGHVATAMMIKQSKDKKERAFYVRGAILHRGREHAPRYLPQWYRVYTNTSVRNWTVF